MKINLIETVAKTIQCPDTTDNKGHAARHKSENRRQIKKKNNKNNKSPFKMDRLRVILNCNIKDATRKEDGWDVLYNHA